MGDMNRGDEDQYTPIHFSYLCGGELRSEGKVRKKRRFVRSETTIS